MGTNFVVGVILARLLGPKPYGQVALAMLVIGFGYLVADVGFGSALIQKEETSTEDIRFSFTVQVLFSVLIVGTIWPVTPWLAAFFHQPETVPVMRAMYPMFILQAFGLTATGLLSRKLRQKTIQTAQLASYLLGYAGLGIPLAIWGAGVWSLVVAQLTQTLLNTIIVYLGTRHSIMPVLWPRSAQLMRYGGKVVGTNIFNWWISNSDNLFVGRVCGVTELGLYSRSFMLVYLPVSSVVSTLQAVLFPAYSRTQNRLPSVQQTYLASVAVVAIVMLPVFAVVAAIPYAFVAGIYGPRWIAAVPVIVPLALAMCLHSIMALAGPALWGVGRVERELRAQIITAVAMAGAMVITSRISFVAVGWGVLVIYLLRAALLTRAAIRTLALRWADIGLALRAPVLIALVVAPMIAASDHFVFVRIPGMGLRLALDALVAAVTFGVLLIASFPLWTEEMRGLIDRMSSSSRAVRLTLGVIFHSSPMFGSAAERDE